MGFHLRVFFYPLLLLLIRTGNCERKSLDELSACLNKDNFPKAGFVPRNTSSKYYQILNYQLNNVNYIQPLAYIVPETSAQVQTAIRCTRTLEFLILIKSGGHSYEKYSFGNGSSVIISLSKLNSMSVDKQSSTALIGPAVLMAQLQYNAWKNGNFVTPATICVSVGTGGAIQGGGYGYLSKKFGLMADNVLAIKIVTVNGSFLTIDSSHYDDLYWAVRGGGGGSFGIVTEFKIRLYDASNFRYNLITLRYALSQFVEVFDAFQKFCFNNVNNSNVAHLRLGNHGISVFIFGINLSEDSVKDFTQAFPKPATSSNNSFTNFLDVALKVPFTAHITQLAQLKDYNQMNTAPTYAKTKSWLTTKVISKESVATLGRVLTRIPKHSSFAAISFGGMINSVPPEATAFVHRNAIHESSLKIGSNNSETLTWVEDFKRAILVLDEGKSYSNMADGTLTNYLDKYYGKNLRRLRQIKKKYDPTNYLNFPQSIPPI